MGCLAKPPNTFEDSKVLEGFAVRTQSARTRCLGHNSTIIPKSRVMFDQITGDQFLVPEAKPGEGGSSSTGDHVSFLMLH